MTVATLRRLYHERTGRPFPGGDGKVAELAQSCGGWLPAGEVVRMMEVWAAAMGAALASTIRNAASTCSRSGAPSSGQVPPTGHTPNMTFSARM